MNQAFNFLLETRFEDRTILGAGMLRVVNGTREINGLGVETMRMSFEVLLAVVPSAPQDHVVLTPIEDRRN